VQHSAAFSIRSYAEADLGAIRAMLAGLQEDEFKMESNRALWADGGAAYTDWMLEEAKANSGIVILAVTAADAPIGVMACWRAMDETDITVVPEARPHLYVSDLFVAASWRGRGVAGVLLAEAERHGRALGLAQMTIGVLAANGAARRAYEKAGFDEYEMLLRKRL